MFERLVERHRGVVLTVSIVGGSGTDLAESWTARLCSHHLISQPRTTPAAIVDPAEPREAPHEAIEPDSIPRCDVPHNLDLA